MNINLQEMKTAVLARIAEVEKRTGWKLPNIEIRYDLKSRRLAGEAIYNYGDRSRLIMRLNPIMWNYNKQHYIYDTVVHEWSHLVDVYFNGKSSHHGSEWQNIMLKAGVTQHVVIKWKSLKKYELADLHQLLLAHARSA